MEQLVLNISSKKDADMIRELLKRFKNVQISCFDTDLPPVDIQTGIHEGLRDAEEGRTQSWDEIKPGLIKRIKGK